MNLTTKLALSQLKSNRNRSLMTILGIVLSSAMLTAVCGFAASAKEVLDRATGYSYSDGKPMITIVLIGALLGAVIVAASVIVVSNMFRLSAGERTRQFGILKGVGATKKQVAASVLSESLLLSVIGIPIGISIGLLIDFIGISVIENLLLTMTSGGTLHLDSEAYLDIRLSAPPLMFVIATAVSLGTALLSAWFPARKASKIPAIDAIRSAGEIRMKNRSFRVSGWVEKLFGFEGVLAAKSLKRSRRSFRATVLSLTISIVLLIAAGSFSAMMKSAAGLIFPDIDATVEAYWASDLETRFGADGQPDRLDYIPLAMESAAAITEKFRDFGGHERTQIYGIGKSAPLNVTLPDGTTTAGELITVDASHYAQLCKEAGVKAGAAILINLRRETEAGKAREYAPWRFADFLGQTLTCSAAGREPIAIEIAGALTGEDVSFELSYLCESAISIIVPECEMIRYVWFATPDDTQDFLAFGKEILDALAPKPQGEISVSTACNSIEDVTKQFRDMNNTIMFFVYGFAGMLALIAVASVISTISANIRSRAGEFAVLQSVGMTQNGIKRMLNLESILCSIRSLIFGLPTGIIAAYGLYQGMGFSADLAFAFLWLSVLECILGVFLITWMTMRFSAIRMRKNNIIESIRGKGE